MVKPVKTQDTIPCSEQLLFDNRIVWLTVKDAARYLRRSENAIRLLIYKGTLCSYRLDSKVYLKKSEIDSLLERSIVQGGVYGN